MLVEALEKAITYRWPGGEVRLEPGKPVELPKDRARKLLEKAAGKVRVVKPTHDWLAAWRELAAITNGIMREDPRCAPVLAALSQCDDCYLANDWTTFQRAAERVREVVRGPHG